MRRKVNMHSYYKLVFSSISLNTDKLVKNTPLEQCFKTDRRSSSSHICKLSHSAVKISPQNIISTIITARIMDKKILKPKILWRIWASNVLLPGFHFRFPFSIFKGRPSCRYDVLQCVPSNYEQKLFVVHWKRHDLWYNMISVK